LATVGKFKFPTKFSTKKSCHMNGKREHEYLTGIEEKK
jgi:hypothetical protein